MYQKKKPVNKKLWTVILILSLLLLIGAALALILHGCEAPFDPKDFHNPSSAAGTGEPAPVTPEVQISDLPGSDPAPDTTEPELPENPIDFAALQELNPHAYGWIYVPMGGEDKDIDLPILHPGDTDDDNFYLHHNIYRDYQFSGCIYTQRRNGTDFTDRVTLVYGHNMLDGTMFSNLVWFQDPDFFRDHDVFYIYLPGHILTYRIAAAIQFDDRHILNAFDFSDDEVYESWIQNYVLNPKTMIRSVREGISVTTDDRLVILSTCLEHGKYRYLIQGVLISDEPTK